MDKVLTGKFPEEISYVCRKETLVSVGSEFDYSKIDGENDYEKILATPAFVIEHGNKKTLETAKKWAKYFGDNYINIVTVKNTPIKKIKITNKEMGYQGSIVYKCIIDDTYHVELKEDVVLDSILNCEISNGYLKGEFIWATGAVGMNLVRINSSRYKAILNYCELSAIKIKDFEVGAIYFDKNLHEYLYLGKFNTIHYLDSGESKKIRGHCYKSINNMNDLYNTDIDNTIGLYDFKQQFPGVLKKGNTTTAPADFIENLKNSFLNFLFDGNDAHKHYSFLYRKRDCSSIINMVPFPETPIDLIEKRLALEIFK